MPQPSHQKQALSFLLSRERGWNLSGLRRDVWRSYDDRFGWTRYQNTLNGMTQAEPPKQFRGGILADEMGLGKTLSMLALLAAAGTPTSSCSCHGDLDLSDSIPTTTGTLIVMPLSLLTVWDSQIKSNMGNGFRSLVYYGQGRQAPRSDLESCDAVITTYNVVASEWKNRKRPGKVPTNSTHDLFSLKWHRLVLDEAHMIRGSSTQNARAVREVDAIHRWCITGTPLQNRVSDISSLLQFLRVYPYDNPKTFVADIIEPWKDEINDKALYRLRLLMKMIALHRSKKIINLPPREEIIKEIYFNTNELKIYESAREGTIRLLDQTLSSGPASASTYLNAFQRMNEMRYICNHGTSKSNNNAESVEPELDQDENTTNEHELDHILDNSDEACLICGTDISEQQESSIYANSIVAVKKEQLRLCIICAQKGAKTPILQLPTPPSSQDDIMQLNDLEKELPSKIKAIVSYIQEIPQGDKCVIFSVWTTTLDIMYQGLTAAGIHCCRYQGSMRYANRTESLEKFRVDESIKVILVSITCGGQGLNLTTANHCILIEPQWNPMVEEQAISRIHRLGQKKAVFICRFVIINTFEQRILERQTRKRVLADLVLGRQKPKEGDDGRKQLAHLRQLIC
ncbi:hypothetical protein NA56DRAFT_206781 [Hyaloscypha hepaticicola]|uniref:P-loop containing nucleoside triphosphate hydrolase protein n=1 Tax=Hyaloscypha hepaticicola TaxID=2082293 RepID=A0A2J6PZ20_9HELO|nr:hypothetical protein NA56DRAFT_206781 [Hyaloscypha hepaticicola]